MLGGMAQDKRRLQKLDHVARAQCTSALSSGFHISQDNAEALDRRAGKTKHCLISYFLSNASAKNYRNRIVYGQIYRKWKVGRFFLRHSVERNVSMVILDSFRELSRSQKVFTWIHKQ